MAEKVLVAIIVCTVIYAFLASANRRYVAKKGEATEPTKTTPKTCGEPVFLLADQGHYRVSEVELAGKHQFEAQPITARGRPNGFAQYFPIDDFELDEVIDGILGIKPEDYIRPEFTPRYALKKQASRRLRCLPAP